MAAKGLIEEIVCSMQSHESFFKQNALLGICGSGFWCCHPKETGVKHVHIVTITSKSASIGDTIGCTYLSFKTSTCNLLLLCKSFANAPTQCMLLPNGDRHLIRHDVGYVYGVYVPTRCWRRSLYIRWLLHYIPKLFHGRSTCFACNVVRVNRLKKPYFISYYSSL